MEIFILIGVLVLGLSYAILPQIFSLGLDDREPPAEPERERKLREEKEKWIQGIVDLETEYELGNLAKNEFQERRRQYKQRAILAHQKLQHLKESGEKSREEDTLGEQIEGSIEKKKSELA